MRTLRPSCVRALTKSQLHTWFSRSGLSRTLQLSLSHKQPSDFCLFGTFNPSRRQILFTSASSCRVPWEPSEWLHSRVRNVDLDRSH
jgi:hypothetical protein